MHLNISYNSNSPTQLMTCWKLWVVLCFFLMRPWVLITYQQDDAIQLPENSLEALTLDLVETDHG